MQINLTTFIGLAAGLLTTFAFLPQVIKSWKTKATKDLSLPTFILQCGAVVLWVIYGTFIKELPVILWNALTAVLVFIIIILKLRYK